MKKQKLNKILKYLAIVVGVILLLAIGGYLYVDQVATGSGEGILPEGYSLIEANGMAFSTKISGDEKDVPVILLHGFPETAAMWERLMSDLNKEGYYTIAPNQRGYSFGARPSEIDQYEVPHLAKDVIAIADALEIQKFHLVGHDWGSGVGWQVAAQYPERLLSYTSMSVPHLTAFSRAYREDPQQNEASNYMRNFQTRIIPEFVLARNDYKLLLSLWSKQGEKEKNAHLNLFREKNALTSAINWYRANFSGIAEGVEIGSVSIPVLFIWGNKDRALLRSGVDWTRDHISGYYRFVELEAGHWLVQESYDSVKSEILTLLSKFPS